MKTLSFTVLSVALLSLVSLGAQAQQYKYQDASGRVIYSDVAPPPGTKLLSKTQGGKTPFVESNGLPYSVSQPTKNFPVVLFTGANCEACNQGRAFLNKRGVPFQEKTIGSKEDQDEFQKITGTTNVPTIMVGNSKQVGFLAESWSSALDYASYPKQNQLPSTYKNPPPVAAGPDKKPDATQTAAAAPAPAAAPPAAAPTAAPAAPAASAPEWFKKF